MLEALEKQQNGNDAIIILADDAAEEILKAFDEIEELSS